MTPTLVRIAFAAAAFLPLMGYQFDTETPYADIRLGYGRSPVSDKLGYDFIPDGGGNHIRVRDEFDDTTLPAYSIGIVGGSNEPIGWALGIEGNMVAGRTKLAKRTENGTAVALQDHQGLWYRSNGGRLLLGGEATFTERLHLELLGFVGGGRLHFDAINHGENFVGHVNGWYTEVGIRAGLYYRVRRAVFGLCAEYVQSRMSDAYAGWADGITKYDDSSWGGFGGRFELGYRLQ